MLLALEAHRQAPGPETDAVLLGALRLLNVQETSDSVTQSTTAGCTGPWQGWISTQGMTGTSALDGAAASPDLDGGEVKGVGLLPGGDCSGWFGDPTSGRRYSVAEDGRRLWLGPLDGPWDVDMKLDGRSWVSGPAGFAGERLLLESPGSVRLVDSATGAPIGGPIMGLAEDPLVLLSPDGQRSRLPRPPRAALTAARQPARCRRRRRAEARRGPG